jgi:hypothetical protein
MRHRAPRDYRPSFRIVVGELLLGPSFLRFARLRQSSWCTFRATPIECLELRRSPPTESQSSPPKRSCNSNVLPEHRSCGTCLASNAITPRKMARISNVLEAHLPRTFRNTAAKNRRAWLPA